MTPNNKANGHDTAAAPVVATSTLDELLRLASKPKPVVVAKTTTATPSDVAAFVVAAIIGLRKPYLNKKTGETVDSKGILATYKLAKPFAERFPGLDMYATIEALRTAGTIAAFKAKGGPLLLLPQDVTTPAAKEKGMSKDMAAILAVLEAAKKA